MGRERVHNFNNYLLSTQNEDACIVPVISQTIFKHFPYRFLCQTLNPSWGKVLSRGYDFLNLESKSFEDACIAITQIVAL